MSKNTQFKERRNMLISIIKHPFCWPGGYDRIAITSDGGLLCADCCKKNAGSIMSSIRENCSDGWKIDAIVYDATGPELCKENKMEDLVSCCDNCNKEFGELC